MDKSCCSQKNVFNLSPCQTFLPLLAGIQALESRISLKSVIWHLFGSQVLNPESKTFQDYITWEEITTFINHAVFIILWLLCLLNQLGDFGLNIVLNFAHGQSCQLSQIIQETPGFGPYFPVFSLESESFGIITKICCFLWYLSFVQAAKYEQWRGVWNKALSAFWCNIKFS